MGHTVMSKVCKDCGKRKAVSYFYQNLGGLLGRRPECSACTKIRLEKTNEKKRRSAARTQFATLVLNPACLFLIDLFGFWELFPAH